MLHKRAFFYTQKGKEQFLLFTYLCSSCIHSFQDVQDQNAKWPRPICFIKVRISPSRARTQQEENSSFYFLISSASAYIICKISKIKMLYMSAHNTMHVNDLENNIKNFSLALILFPPFCWIFSTIRPVIESFLSLLRNRNLHCQLQACRPLKGFPKSKIQRIV